MNGSDRLLGTEDRTQEERKVRSPRSDKRVLVLGKLAAYWSDERTGRSDDFEVERVGRMARDGREQGRIGSGRSERKDRTVRFSVQTSKVAGDALASGQRKPDCPTRSRMNRSDKRQCGGGWRPLGPDCLTRSSLNGSDKGGAEGKAGQHLP